MTNEENESANTTKTSTPPAPDEADKALAQQDDRLAQTILRPIRGCATDSQYSDAFDRAVAALAQARKETWEKAIKVVTKVHERTLGSVSDWQVLGPLESAMKKDLESASTKTNQ